MDFQTYKNMQKLKDRHTKNTIIDINALGSMSLKQTNEHGKLRIKKINLYSSIETNSEGNLVVKFCDESGKLIAIYEPDYAFVIGEHYKELELPENKDNLDFLHQFTDLNNKGISLKQTEQICKTLDISPEEIRSVTTVNLGKNNKQTKDDKQSNSNVHLKEDKNPPTQISNNSQPNATIKNKTNMNISVTNNNITLGKLLHEDGELVVVRKDDIKDGVRCNSTFCLLIQDKDGNLKEPQNISQLGGISPSFKVVAADTDGKVHTQQPDSAFMIKSDSNNMQYGITIKIDSTGVPQIGIAQFDKTQGKNSSDIIGRSAPLKTSHNNYTSYYVKDTMTNEKDGTENLKNGIKEYSACEKVNCSNKTVEQADGDPSTGHTHEETLNEIDFIKLEIEEIAANILNENPDIDRAYTAREVEARLLNNYNKDSQYKTMEQITEEVTSDMNQEAVHIHTRSH